MRSLFEMLGAAGLERIHTQTLAWLLTPSDSPLSTDERHRLLEALACHCDAAYVDQLDVYTEMYSLDLVVCNRTDVLLVLENKLKARQSDQQLLGYDGVLSKLAHELKRGCAKTAKVFLTLSKETSNTPGWQDVDYSAVAAALSSHEASLYVRDYADLVRRLTAARDAFISGHRNYPEILKRVAQSKLKRLRPPFPKAMDDVSAFVHANALERTLVETLYRNVAASVPGAMVDAGARGVPLIQVKHWLVEIGSTWYRAGLQLQGKTLKLNIADVDYEKSARSDAIKVVDQYFEQARLKANNATAKSYRSWSRKAPASLVVETASLAEMERSLTEESEGAKRQWETALEAMLRDGAIASYQAWSAAEEVLFRKHPRRRHGISGS